MGEPRPCRDRGRPEGGGSCGWCRGAGRRGGEEHTERHLAATADLINSLALGTGDLVSLLDANEIRDPGQRDPGFTPLVGARWAEQQAAFKQALLPVKAQRGAKVVPYSLEKQGL